MQFSILPSPPWAFDAFPSGGGRGGKRLAGAAPEDCMALIQHRSPGAALPRRVWSKLACEPGLEEGVHILRALHKDSLLVVIGQDEEALLLYRLDDALPHLVGCHQHAMENG